VLVTDRAKVIPAYFIGHWVEVRAAATGALRGTWRIGSIGADGRTVVLTPSVGEQVMVESGDLWQGVYRFDEYTVRGNVQVVSVDPIRVYSEQVITGTMETDAIYADRLVVKPGGKLTQRPTSAGSPQSLRIEVRELVVEAGGSIDVDGRGYPLNVTYPEHVVPTSSSGGSHLGEGGVSGVAGETFGSVYRPQENGGGNLGVGGGVVRVVAERVQIDGAVRANGAGADRGGAGGSVWITTGDLSGSGSIEAVGGNSAGGSTRGSGGGGAIAVEYSNLEGSSTLLDHLDARGGTTGVEGGAGTVYVRAGSAAYGHLIVDNKTVANRRRTILPSLGNGVAQTGSTGTVLVTDRAKVVSTYFIGHWVEVRAAATGALRGTWRIGSIGVDGRTVVLTSSTNEPVVVEAGDLWQGVYRFDEYTVRGNVQVVSVDPIRVYSEQAITGTVETDAIYADRLVVKHGGKLTQRPTTASSPQSLRIEVRELVVETGGSIEVDGRGYPLNVTYPGHVVPTSASGGSHLGEGGVSGVAGETFGSVYRPQENGGGSASLGVGGGVVRVLAERVQIDGVIRANGTGGDRGGAGGSVWITTGVLSGSGSIEAVGGNSAGGSTRGSGGGGAIALEYSTLEASSTLLDQLDAQGGTTGVEGGAGTVYVRAGSAAHGHLIVDNKTVANRRRTILPSLGSGAAQTGSTGTVLVTDRAKVIPAYFIGHWVEVRAAATGALRGTWRIGSIGLDGRTVVLTPSPGEPVVVEVGDSWQGVYRFDEYTVRGNVQVVSVDPIRVYSEQVIIGTMETDAIYADRLVVKPGGKLTQRPTTASAPQSLRIEVRELVVETGGAIEVDGRGYPLNVTYPGHVVSTSGGSHLGEGGASGGAGETFGSVYRPQENGGGSASLGVGGGVVRIMAERVQIDGVIDADGTGGDRGGAGGSVWITTGELSGSGSIEAVGGNSAGNSLRGSGGGGAIAIDYAVADASSTLLDHLDASGGTTGVQGGAGTIYLRGPQSTTGVLTIDNRDTPGNRRTILPPLGRGIVQDGSSGATILTGRDTNIPAYFVGHWVEIEGPDRVVKGAWRIATIAGTTVELEPKPGVAFTILPGDRWRGIYRFDEVTVAPGATLVSLDKLVQLVPPLPAESRRGGPRAIWASSSEDLYGNDTSPVFDRSRVSIAVGSLPGSYRVTVAASSLVDPDGIAEVHLTSGSRLLATDWTTEGATFLWPGYPGQELHLVATDAHDRVRRSTWLELPPLPDGGWAPQLRLARGVAPSAVAGGPNWLAIGAQGVWIYDTTGLEAHTALAMRAPDEEVVAFAAENTDRLYIASAARVDVLDPLAQTLVEVPFEESRVLDVVSGDDRATVLLTDPGADTQPLLRLAEIEVTDTGVPTASGSTVTGIPMLTAPSLTSTAAHLHLFGLEENGSGSIFSWETNAAGSLTGVTPEVATLPDGWRGVGAWQRGAVVFDDVSVRLLEHDGFAWTEVARIVPEAPPTAAAVAGDSLVVLVAGDVLVFDVTQPAAPVLLGRHSGASYRAVEPLSNGEVLLWSPPLATPPLRWNPRSATSNEGFRTVLEGLP
jgi:hypothetical protein